MRRLSRLLAHEGVDKVESAVLRHEEQNVARRLAIDAQKNTDDDRLRPADEVGNLVERDDRNLRHIHINAAIDKLRQGRRRVPRTDISYLPQHIKLYRGEIDNIFRHNCTSSILA